MIYSSRDVLFTISAFCILWLTILCSWALYYVALILRDAYKSWKEAKQTIENVNNFFKHTADRLTLIAEGITAAVSLLNIRKARRASNKKGKQDEE